MMLYLHFNNNVRYTHFIVCVDVTVYRVEDMHCSHCEAAVVRAVEEVPGVEKAKASASANTLTIKGSATEEAIRTAVEGIGYTFKGKM